MRITNETTVTINYKVSEQNGGVLEQSDADQPVTYLQGLAMMLPSVEAALEGKVPGDKVRLELPVEKAYGPRSEELITKMPAGDFEDPAGLSAGQDIVIGDGEDEVLMTILEVTDQNVTLDGNHPFAGKDIVFEVEVVDVHKTTDEDLKAFEDFQ